MADLLAGGVRVLVYAGDVDFVCNWIGNKAWTIALDWPSHDAFDAAPDTPWAAAVSENAAGLARAAGGLTFLQVYEAGHLVPMDQPDVALSMLNTFTAAKAFA